MVVMDKRKSTILLIDPNFDEAKDLSDRLSSVGFNILSAHTEDMALKLAQISNPDIILIDIFVEGNQFTDILSLLKSNNITANIPVIIISSDVDINSKVYGFLAGANDYIVKPYRFPEVLARINTQLRILCMQQELEKKNNELMSKNALLEQMAITDGLTCLYNKTYILTRLNGEISHCARYNEPISFIMLDIDNFKKINDTYGHVAGDIILKNVAGQILKSIRDVDIASRYGGEEFLVVCPNTDLTGTQVLAERIRENVQNCMFKLSDTNKVFVTVSLGIRCVLPNPSMSNANEIDRLISEADAALYKAKTTGKNKVEVFVDRDDVSNPNDKITSKKMVVQEIHTDSNAASPLN